MKMRKLEPSEHIKTRELWEKVFQEDTSAFLDYYYFIKTRENEIYVIEEDEKIRSMIHLNPYTVKVEDTQFKGNYIVAVATEKEYRKRGCMGALLRKTMQDMYQDGQLFTFLMPAAEKIYTPYDFRFVYDQDQTDLPVNDGELACECVDAGMCDASLMAEFFEKNFADRWQVCAVRDSMYYQSLLFERQSEHGGIKLLKKQGELIGMFSYMQEEQLEIMEPLYLPEYEDVFCQAAAWMCRSTTGHSVVKVYAYCGGETEKKPTIMVRILRLEKLLTSLKVRKGMQMDCSFAVLDAVLPQNSKIWRIQGNGTELLEEENCTRHLQVKETEDSEGVLTIGALTSLLFGYKSVEEVAVEEDVILPKHLQEELKKIQPLQNVFLNELV